MCKVVSPTLQVNETHYPWNIPKANRRALRSMTSYCEPDRENNIYPGYWERFTSHEDISGWIYLSWDFISFHHFSGPATTEEEGEKKRNWRCLSIYGTLFCFHLSIFHIVKKKKRKKLRLGLLLVFFWTFRKSSRSDTNSVCSVSEQRYILL